MSRTLEALHTMSIALVAAAGAEARRPGNHHFVALRDRAKELQDATAADLRGELDAAVPRHEDGVPDSRARGIATGPAVGGPVADAAEELAALSPPPPGIEGIVLDPDGALALVDAMPPQARSQFLAGLVARYGRKPG